MTDLKEWLNQFPPRPQSLHPAAWWRHVTRPYEGALTTSPKTDTTLTKVGKQ